MTKIIIFEGQDEVIVGLKKDREKLKKLWFTDAGRNLEDYDISTCDITDGFSVGGNIRIDTADRLKEYEWK